MKLIKLAVVFILLGILGCQAQITNKMKEKNNPLLCDPETGICKIPEYKDSPENELRTVVQGKPVKVIYYTDPICSSCWGIEPQLRKLKLEYGNAIEIEYRMGGLLPDWSYNSGGISKPSDVAHHWDEVSVYYDMPIDGDVWFEDPLNSSYPPSIAFKAAQLQDNEKALLFMREMREMVFLRKMNIAKWENIVLAAEMVGLDTDQLKSDYEGKAVNLFHEDLKLAQKMGVRGFPTMFFKDNYGNTEVVYGSKPYSYYEMALLKLDTGVNKNEYSKTWESLFSKYHSLTAKEYTELSGISRIESEKLLNSLVTKGHLQKLSTKNGSIWTVRNTFVSYE